MCIEMKKHFRYNSTVKKQKMKKIILCVLLIAALSAIPFYAFQMRQPDEAATNPSYSNTVSIEDIQLIIDQKNPIDGMFTDFILRVGETKIPFKGQHLADWDPPQIHYTDLTGDHKNDIIVIFHSDSGTEVHGEDIHIFDGVTLKEYDTETLLPSVFDHVNEHTENGVFYLMIDRQKCPVDTEKLYYFSPSGDEYLYVSEDYFEYSVSENTLRIRLLCGIWGYGMCGYIDAGFKFIETGFVFDTAEFIQYEGWLSKTF